MVTMTSLLKALTVHKEAVDTVQVAKISASDRICLLHLVLHLHALDPVDPVPDYVVQLLMVLISVQVALVSMGIWRLQ